jgi:5-methylcytosine-specific restriction enzyme A
MPQRPPIAKPPGSEHKARDRERQRRAGGIRRLYDSAQWRRRTQPTVLMRDPMCKIAELCGGTAPSTDADHVIPAAQYIAQHGGDERWFFDLSNLQGACHADHTHKTARGG